MPVVKVITTTQVNKRKKPLKSFRCVITFAQRETKIVIQQEDFAFSQGSVYSASKKSK